VIVDDLDVMGISVVPDEADPPLLVDADAVLASPIPEQGLEPIAGRDLQRIQPRSRIELQELPQGHPLN
jgi:hypothetical protein